MLLRIYRYAFLKILNWQMQRDFYLHTPSENSDKPESINQINRQYIKDRASEILEHGMAAVSKLKWLMAGLAVGFSINLCALVYRPLRYFGLDHPLAEPVLMGVSLISLIFIFLGACQLHKAIMMDIDTAGVTVGTDRWAHKQELREFQKSGILVINMICTLTISLLALSLIPITPSVISIVPAALMTIYMATQGVSRKITEESLDGVELKRYLQLTQKFYPPVVIEMVLFRQLEGTPVTMSYLMGKQIDPLVISDDDECDDQKTSHPPLNLNL